MDYQLFNCTRTRNCTSFMETSLFSIQSCPSHSWPLRGLIQFMSQLNALQFYNLPTKEDLLVVLDSVLCFNLALYDPELDFV